jgi:hypothetical protein
MVDIIAIKGAALGTAPLIAGYSVFDFIFL